MGYDPVDIQTRGQSGPMSAFTFAQQLGRNLVSAMVTCGLFPRDHFTRPRDLTDRDSSVDCSRTLYR